MLAAPSLGKLPIKVPNLKPLRLVLPPSHDPVNGFLLMHSIGSRFVTGPSHMLFGGVYVCTFQPGNFTGCGSEGVNSS